MNQLQVKYAHIKAWFQEWLRSCGHKDPYEDGLHSNSDYSLTSINFTVTFGFTLRLDPNQCDIVVVRYEQFNKTGIEMPRSTFLLTDNLHVSIVTWDDLERRHIFCGLCGDTADKLYRCARCNEARSLLYTRIIPNACMWIMSSPLPRDETHCVLAILCRLATE